jgi:hypothetical protein
MSNFIQHLFLENGKLTINAYGNFPAYILNGSLSFWDGANKSIFRFVKCADIGYANKDILKDLRFYWNPSERLWMNPNFCGQIVNFSKGLLSDSKTGHMLFGYVVDAETGEVIGLY